MATKTLKLTQIGNSTGVVLPRELLDNYPDTGGAWNEGTSSRSSRHRTVSS